MADAMKTYREGERFPGRIGPTWEDSEPAFPMPPAAPEGAPNILYVIVDDIGFGWTGPFGGLIRTPNIQRLADNGLRYTNFTTTALCSPTRSCLITGRNHHSVGMANITELATGFPGYNGRQPQNKAGVPAMLHQYGYTSFGIGKWHNTPSEKTAISGPYDPWPTGSVFGFDRFYGFLGGDCDQWYPKLFLDREAIDQPRLPEDGYHLSEDLVDRAISWTTQHRSIDPTRPWLTWLAFGAMHAPHHVAPEWIERYRGAFDMGWDAYREQTLARQKELGIVPEHTRLAPMLEGVQRWEELSGDERRLFTPMAEIYAGYMEHTDAQMGRLVDALEHTGQLDNTLIFVCVGDNGSSGEGTLNGLFNEQSIGNMVQEPVEQNLARLDQFGQPGSYNHYPVGWAIAGNTPFQLCKQYTHFGGVRNPLVVHWPRGIRARGELRHQYHHVTDIVPTILEAIGVEAPTHINSVQQEPVEGDAMNYSFDDADAPSTHTTQYFEMLGNRGLYRAGWKIVTYHGRKPWENKAAWGFDEDHWELYNLADDPSGVQRPDAGPRPGRPGRPDGQEAHRADRPVVGRGRQVPGAAAGRPVPGTRARPGSPLRPAGGDDLLRRLRPHPAVRGPTDPQPLLGDERRGGDPPGRRRGADRRDGRHLVRLVAVPQGVDAEVLLQLRRRVHLHPRQPAAAAGPAPGALRVREDGPRTVRRRGRRAAVRR
jgi:arylsulfatase A-like enzyme